MVVTIKKVSHFKFMLPRNGERRCSIDFFHRGQSSIRAPVDISQMKRKLSKTFLSIKKFRQWIWRLLSDPTALSFENAVIPRTGRVKIKKQSNW